MKTSVVSAAINGQDSSVVKTAVGFAACLFAGVSQDKPQKKPSAADQVCAILDSWENNPDRSDVAYVFRTGSGRILRTASK